MKIFFEHFFLYVYLYKKVVSPAFTFNFTARNYFIYFPSSHHHRRFKSSTENKRSRQLERQLREPNRQQMEPQHMVRCYRGIHGTQQLVRTVMQHMHRERQQRLPELCRRQGIVVMVWPQYTQRWPTKR